MVSSACTLHRKNIYNFFILLWDISQLQLVECSTIACYCLVEECNCTVMQRDQLKSNKHQRTASFLFIKTSRAVARKFIVVVGEGGGGGIDYSYIQFCKTDFFSTPNHFQTKSVERNRIYKKNSNSVLATALKRKI